MAADKKCDYTFIWNIENYLSSYQKQNEKIRSPMFIIKSLKGSKWYLELYPRGMQVFWEKYVACSLYREDENEELEKFIIDYEIDLIGENGEALLPRTKYKKLIFESRNCHPGRLDIDSALLFNKMKTWRKDSLTVRCRIISDQVERSDVIKGCEARTVIGIDSCLFKWKVKTPSFEDWSESARFSTPEESEFNIILSTLEKALLVDLKIPDDQSLPKSVVARITLFNDLGDTLSTKCDIHQFETSTSWRFPSFIVLEELKISGVDSAGYEFTLMCDIRVSNKCIASSGIVTGFCSLASRKDSSHVTPLTSVLLNDFRNLFDNKKFSDVKFRAGDEEFHVHKMVLGIRSPVFTAMFDQDMLENQTGVVDIKDMDSITLKTFLEFIYTENVPNWNYDCATKLLLAAEKYQVPSLKENCCCFLRSVLSLENICEVVTLADMINHESLKSTALNFIKRNASKILSSADWSVWIEGNVKLATEILSVLSLDLGSSSFKTFEPFMLGKLQFKTALTILK